MSVYKTTDGGRTWGTRRNLGNEGSYSTSCRDIAVAPSDSSIVYAGGQVDGYVKIWCSDDAGSSWVDITENLASMHSRYDLVYAIWVAPDDPYALVVGTSKGVYQTAPSGRDPRIRGWGLTPLTHSTRAFAYDQARGILYAATERQGVYYTNDRGSSWVELNDGLGYLKTLCIGLDSENDLLFIGTDGGSVWRLSLGETNPSDVDLNSDGVVNFTDLAILTDNWMHNCSDPDWCQGSDFNTSGNVDFVDLLDLVNHWLQ